MSRSKSHVNWELRVKDTPEFKAKRLASQRRWTKNNPEYRPKWRREIRAKVVALLGGRCADPRCAWVNDDGTMGCTNPLCLQIDHINGGGLHERRQINGGEAFLRKVAGDQTGYQLLCANCNWIKRNEREEYRTGKGVPVAA